MKTSATVAAAARTAAEDRAHGRCEVGEVGPVWRRRFVDGTFHCLVEREEILERARTRDEMRGREAAAQDAMIGSHHDSWTALYPFDGVTSWHTTLGSEGVNCFRIHEISKTSLVSIRSAFAPT